MLHFERSELASDQQSFASREDFRPEVLPQHCDKESIAEKIILRCLIFPLLPLSIRVGFH